MKKIRDFLISLKVYFARTASYISLINSAMILFLLLSDLEKYGIDLEIKDWIVPLFVLGIVSMLIFGYLEYTFFFEAEQKKTSERNPYTKDIIARLERIERRLGKKK
jgi:di/tricarboxylate transporter